MPWGVGRIIDQSSPRTLFAQLVARALRAIRVEASPVVTAYLIELLEARLAEPVPVDGAAMPARSTLAEALLTARALPVRERAEPLRQLGDRALFVAGFFGDSLARRAVDLDYYGDVGRLAYADLSATLAHRLARTPWPLLYEELADRFLELVDVLAEVSDGTRPDRAVDLLRIHERYRLTGSRRDRERLLQHGCPVPPSGAARRLQ